MKKANLSCKERVLRETIKTSFFFVNINRGGPGGHIIHCIILNSVIVKITFVKNVISQ